MEKTQQRRYDSAASRWAGVGPYYAMFPVSFATTAVRKYTKPGDCVFDPFAGRGTSLFAAAAEGRMGLGIEINPVGWVYGKAKLQTAEFKDVKERIQWLGKMAPRYHREANALPEFFVHCFCPEVRKFLLAARQLLDWRHKKTDWTTMALLMIDLHGKRESALSNQMRQTKSMSPQYAIRWWKEHGFKPPEREPVEFMLKKAKWRYAKGRLDSNASHVYLGDSQFVLNRLGTLSQKMCSKLLLTSPPYYGITNYFYDQWLRLWLLGGTNYPLSPADGCKRKFQNKEHYVTLLRLVFKRSRALLKRNAVVYVRTDARVFTREATIEALERAFPDKKIRSEKYSRPTFTQTTLFDSDLETKGEVDIVMW